MLFDKLVKTENKVLKQIVNSLTDQLPLNVTYLNQHCFNIYNSNIDYKHLLDNNFSVFLDGYGIYLALKFLGFKNVQKFNATDLFAKIFKQYSKNQTKLFLIGGNFSNNFLSTNSEKHNLNICGYFNGYFSESETSKLLRNIENALPDVIVIGMNVPKQELLAVKIAKSFQNKNILCVGGFLEFYFGTKKRAPGWMRNFGLEWFHRLFSEPKRLWKRYIIGIPVFIFYIIKLKLNYAKIK